ncbi:MAG: phosphotransferase [Verrucomicrobia bacterium]|nr:phosphotransferase [Verrucomicrobiota bacterium]
MDLAETNCVESGELNARIRRVLAEYGLGAATILGSSRGLESELWRVRLGDQEFALRRLAGTRHCVAEVAAELGILHHLQQPELRTPRPRPRRNDEIGPMIDAGDGSVRSLWSVLSWVEGQAAEGLPSQAQARVLGATMAHLHAQSKSLPIPAYRVRPKYDAACFERAAETLLRDFGPNLLEAQRIRLLQGLAQGCRRLTELGRNFDRCGLIHADLHPGNVVWSELDPRPGLIDFGRCGFGPLVLDLAMAQHYVTPELGAALFAGYAAGASLSESEIAALPALRLLAWIENLAVLADFEHERSAVAHDLAALCEAAGTLVNSAR